MSDKDKYEGHQLSELKISVAGVNHSWVMHQHKHGAIDTMFVKHATAALIADAPLLLAEVKRLQEENKKQLDVLSTLDEMIRYGNDHVEMMKALEQGLDLSETWKEMVA